MSFIDISIYIYIYLCVYMYIYKFNIFICLNTYYSHSLSCLLAFFRHIVVFLSFARGD